MSVCVCVCLCLPVCVHILVFAHNLNQYTQEGGTKATKQLQAAEAANRPCAPNVLSTPQSFQSVQQTTLSTFVSFSPRTQFLFSVCLLETINLWLLPAAHLSSFQFFGVFFFFFPNESFQAWPLCVWKGPLRVTKTVNQSQITLSGLGHVSLVLNDRKKPEMDFREACDNSLHVLMWERILKYPSQWFRFFKTLTLFDKRDQGTTGRHLTGKVKCFTSYKTGNERKLSNTSVSRSEGPL